MKREKIFLPVFAALLFCSAIYAHDPKLQKKTGSISFITPQNVYVEFESTEGLTQGDTIFYKNKDRIYPVIIIKYLSTHSCAGEKIGSLNLKVGDKVYAMSKVEIKTSIDSSNIISKKDTNIVPVNFNELVHTRSINKLTAISRFNGSLSANSYSSFANYINSSNLQRWNYTLNMNAEHIAGSPFYFSNYMSLSYLGTRQPGGQNVSSNVFNNLRIFDLALGYKSDGYNIWLGRHINYNVSNIGSVDGLQAEKTIGNYAVGGIVGSRPDFYNMGFNSKLFEYGGYLTRMDTSKNGFMQNTIAVFQQTNNMQTDRRFLYFQHNDNLLSELNFFLSAEVDLYKMQNNTASNTFSLTNLYFSTQYSLLRNLSFNLSYSAMKNIIYYQTFKSLVDILFNNQTRQGFRLGINWSPLNGTFINAGAGYSYQKGDVKPSRNFNISVTQTEIPFLDLSATVSFNRTFNSYSDGTLYSATLTKYIPINATSISAGYSNVKYNFGLIANTLKQNTATVQLTTRILNSLFFNVYYEGTFEGSTTYGSVMSGFNLRF
ncbi:MAG: hypothetical protein ACYCVH_04065 [Ignavibacteriaceae bacterium]